MKISNRIIGKFNKKMNIKLFVIEYRLIQQNVKIYNLC